MNSLALKYAPIIYMDKREPVEIKRIGFTEYTKNGSKSISFNRKFDFENMRGAVKVLEYAYYLDFDIQHLYDLEHIWVYLDVNDKVVGAEGSFHGRFLNALNKEFGKLENESNIVMYSQPGKHAMVADPKLMYIYTELFSSCGRLAGIYGLDAPERFTSDIHISDEDDKKIVQYIRDNLSFTPSMEFVRCHISDDKYMDGAQLEKEIPGFIKAQLSNLGIMY